MAGVAFSDLQTFGLLKDMYSDDVQFLEHIQSSLYNFIAHASDDEVEFDGAAFKVPLKLMINESYRAGLDSERLPEAEPTQGVFGSYSCKKMYSSLEATTFAATRGHQGGRPNGKFIDDLMKGTLLSFMSNIDFDLYQNGRGFRATIVTATPGAASFTVSSSMYLRPGQKLDWYDSTLVTKRGSIKIDVRGVDRQNKTAYVNASFGSAAVPAGGTAGDILVVYGALDAGEPSDGRHLAGLSRICDNTVAVGGYTSANYAAWATISTNASGANPSQELLQQQIDNTYIISGRYPNRMAFNPGWKRSYLAPFLNQRRFNSNKFDTGATELSFSAVKMGKDERNAKIPSFEMLEDKNAPCDTVYIWVFDAFKFATDYSSSPHLADEDGSELRLRDGYDVLSGFYRFWANTVVFQRNAIGRIYNQATPSGAL